MNHLVRTHVFRIPSYACCSHLFHYQLLVCYRGYCSLSYLFCLMISMHLFNYGSRHHTYYCYFGLHVLSSRTATEPNLKTIPEALILQVEGACWWFLFQANAFWTSSPDNLELIQLFIAHLCGKDSCCFEVQVLVLESFHNLLTRYQLEYQCILSTDNFLTLFRFIKDNVYNRSCHLWARWKIKVWSLFQGEGLNWYHLFCMEENPIKQDF